MIFRVEKNKDYTVMSNYHLRDNTLSLRAKGLLSQILSLPENWDYTIAGLAAINTEGKDAVRSAVQELEKAGYIERRQTTASGGKFGSNEYVVHEQPVCASPLSGFPTTDNPSTDEPSTVEPSTDKPLTENPTELSKDILSTNIPPISPKGDGAGKKSKRRSKDYKAQADVLPQRFEKFWAFYRMHVPPDRNAGNRQAAIKAWDKLAPSDELATTMAMSLAKQVNSQAWAKGIGVPHASTWLNNHGWEDDWGPAAGTPPESATESDEVAEWVN